MRILIIIISLCFVSLSWAQCDKAAFKQFDFWLGEWTVYQKDGKVAGTNTITKQMGNCVVHESYSAASGYHGQSFNIYDASRKLWHQTWVDNSGRLLVLEGRWNGNTMELSGEQVDAKGKKELHRIRWKPKKNGDVHQIWEMSRDKGTHWTSVFYGVYQKKK